MKLVISADYPVFSLSREAEDLYASKIGKKLYRYGVNLPSIFFAELSKTAYKAEKMEHSDGNVGIWYSYAVFTEDHGDFVELGPNIPFPKGEFRVRDIPRDDPILVEVVEELGDKASSRHPHLKIVEIPDNIEYEILEVQGHEYVAESHRTWG